MSIIEILKVIVLGIVEGITEWLPISSTGHMILIDELIQLNVSAGFKDMFFVVIQLGAIIAVLFLFFDKLNPIVRVDGNRAKKDPRYAKKMELKKKHTIQLWIKIIIACVPAAVLGILFDDWLEEHFQNGFIVAMMLIIYGIFFIVVETRNNRHQLFDADQKRIDKLYKMDYHTAFYIGMFQVLSLIPGTSRSGATIIGAILLGTTRTVASEFSFFLAIPIMFGASFVKIWKFGLLFTPSEFLYLAIGMIVAFIVSVFSIRFLMNWVKKHDFVFFGIYRIGLGIIVLIWYILSSVISA